MTNNYISIVQPSQKLAPRVFLPLPDCKGILQYLKKFDFQECDLNISECIQICKFHVDKKRLSQTW